MEDVCEAISSYSRGDDLLPLYQNRVENGVAVTGFTGGGIWKFKFDVVNSVGGDIDVYEDLATCVGPLILLPQKGGIVVYLPQGHLKHLSKYPSIPYKLDPHNLCLIVDVKL
ncbi:hypothetical protein KY285_013685 [Solanum tuberosum]|nr:hypothetical protein KY285_013685 [Solanum tuberosum]